MKLKSQCCDLYRLAVQLVRTFIAEQGVLNSAALTYTTLFSIVPLMTVSYSMLAAIPSFQGVGAQVESLIFDNFLPASGTQIQSHLSGFAAQARTLTFVGIAFLFVTAILMMKNIEAAFNRIWKVKASRSGLNSFLIYWAVLSLGPFLIGAGIALSSYLIGLSRLSEIEEYSGIRLLSMLPWMLTSMAFTLIYILVPNARVPWKPALISGVFAALLFELAKRGFALFVTYSPSYQLIYGAFAAVPIFLVWIYISWSIVLLGAMLSRILTYRGEQTQSSKEWFVAALRLIGYLYQLQQRGEQAPERQILRDVRGLQAHQLHYLRDRLKPLQLLAEDEQGALILKRDLHAVTLSDLFELDPLPAIRGEPLAHWQQLLATRLDQLGQQRRDIFDLSLAQLFAGKVAE